MPAIFLTLSLPTLVLDRNFSNFYYNNFDFQCGILELRLGNVLYRLY